MPTKTDVVVLKLSGRLFFSTDFSELAEFFKHFVVAKENSKLVLVAGGGGPAREYIAIAQKLGIDQSTQDELGIQASRMNARVMMKALGSIAATSLATNLDELVEAFEVTERSKKIFVLGGLQPGQSTNAVAALVAEKLRAKVLINATDVDGVYTKDPHRFKRARMLDKVTPKSLAKILKIESMKAGSYDLMDPVALKLIERSRINTRIVKCNVESLRLALDGKKLGTSIEFES